MKQTWPKTYKNNTIALNPLFLPLNGQPLGLPYQPKFYFVLHKFTPTTTYKGLRNSISKKFTFPPISSLEP